MTRRAPKLPPPTMQERADAAIAARAHNQRVVEVFGQFVRLSLLDRTKFGDGRKPSGKARVGDMRPLSLTSVSIFLGFAEHCANLSSRECHHGISHRSIRTIFDRGSQPIDDTVLNRLQKLASSIVFDAPQCACEIEICASHQAKGQACRGFIRDRRLLTHGVFPAKHAPQRSESIYPRNRIVNTAFDKSPRADFRLLRGRRFNIGQSSGRCAAKPILGGNDEAAHPGCRGEVGGATALLTCARRVSTGQSQTKCGGRIMHCACTIKLKAMAAVTTASTRRLVIVTGLVIEFPLDPVAGDRPRWDGPMAKLSIAVIASIVAWSRRDSKFDLRLCVDPTSQQLHAEKRLQLHCHAVCHQHAVHRGEDRQVVLRLRPARPDAEHPDNPCERSAADCGRHEEGGFDPWRRPEYDKPDQEPRHGAYRCRWQRGCIELPGGPSRDRQGEKKRWTDHDRPPKSEKASHHRRRPSDLCCTAPARSREYGQALLAEVVHEPGKHCCRAEAVGGGVVSEQRGQHNTAIRRIPVGPKQKSLTHSGLAVGTQGRPPSGDHYSDRQVTRLCIAKGRHSRRETPMADAFSVADLADSAERAVRQRHDTEAVKGDLFSGMPEVCL